MARSDDVSRRQVLGTGVTAAAAALVSPVILRAADGGKDDIRCGMIGTGGRGQGVLKAIHKAPGVRVTALCDIHAGRLNQAAGRVQVLTRRLQGREIPSSSSPRYSIANGRNPAP